MKGSIFILVQVSLFIKVFILRRRKAFLKTGPTKGVIQLFGFIILFLFCSGDLECVVFRHKW